jgi:hypothetical protein
MADLKISQLTAITTLTPATDVLPVVDVGGVTKKITTNQILGSGGTATLASATITGAATVGTTLGVTSSLTVGTGANSAVQKAAILGGYTVFENSAGTGNPSITFNNDTDTGILNNGANVLQFNTAGVERARFNQTGAFVLYGGTAGATGIGVAFPTTQSASSDANTLDDYVEATFSPTIVGSTTAGTATYSTQLGRYTKIGRLVTFSLRVVYTGGTGTGNLRVGGLPTAGFGSNFSIYAENIALTASYYPVASISASSAQIGVDQLPTGGGAAASVPYDAAGDIQISGSYIV